MGAVQSHRVPRTRGDGPSGKPTVDVVETVFPAHAGMDRGVAASPGQPFRVFPAHAGMDRGLHGAMPGMGIVFPAHAGMDRMLVLLLVPPRSVPHTRGDGPR